MKYLYCVAYQLCKNIKIMSAQIMKVFDPITAEK